ncbi:MAG: flagellar biosynthesis anti-sigma factor FlgM [Defluviitaleaceae bacterium]|nr:flagellar biosynthesis anti-sigma factor FlgM [Defluviitaleaceae bacterium]
MDMRVTSAYSAYALQPVRSTAPAQKTERVKANMDKVSISAEAGGYQAALAAARSAPDVRADLVGNIRSMLDAGTYNVSATDVASRIFQGLA